MIPACESASQAVEESDARGSKKRRPRGSNSTPRGSNFASSGVPNDLLGRLGRQVGVRRALWARKGQLENCMEGSWDRLGVLLARLRPLSGRLSPPGGAPERLREVIFGGILGSFLDCLLYTSDAADEL